MIERPSKDVPASGVTDEIKLDDQCAALLAIVAAHDRVTCDEWVKKAIAERAEAIGISYLLNTKERMEGSTR